MGRAWTLGRGLLYLDSRVDETHLGRTSSLVERRMQTFRLRLGKVAVACDTIARHAGVGGEQSSFVSGTRFASPKVCNKTVKKNKEGRKLRRQNVVIVESIDEAFQPALKVIGTRESNSNGFFSLRICLLHVPTSKLTSAFVDIVRNSTGSENSPRPMSVWHVFRENLALSISTGDPFRSVLPTEAGTRGQRNSIGLAVGVDADTTPSLLF